jgi:hypothetical protein
MCPLLSFTALPAPEKIWKQLAWWWFLQPFLCFFFGGLASSSLLLPKSTYPWTLNYKILSPQIHDFPSLSNPRLLLTSIHTHSKQLGHTLISLYLSLCGLSMSLWVCWKIDCMCMKFLWLPSSVDSAGRSIYMYKKLLLCFANPRKTKTSAVNEHNAEWF